MKKVAGWIMSVLMMGACEGIDCTLNNVVTCTYAFYNSEGVACTVTDTLTVTAAGTDSILYNRGTNISTIDLPMSYWKEADTLTFTFYNPDADTKGSITLRVTKTNTQHFESPDCPTTMFHMLTEASEVGVSQLADSIVINNPTVNYEAKENIKIYLHTAD